MDASWLWIPITLGAALAQTFRNAAQRRLTADLGTLGATWVRFLYGLPFALAALATWLLLDSGVGMRVLEPAAAGPAGQSLATAMGTRPLHWMARVALGGLAQIAATAALLATMAERGFAIGVAYAKTEVLMVAVFALVVLGDPLSPPVALAVCCGTLGVLLLAPADPARPLRALVDGWSSRAARFGLLAGAGFALSAVGFRGATLHLRQAAGPLDALPAALATLAASMALQALVMGAWLAWRQPAAVRAVLRLWRPSLGAGALGALASAGWFTAFALQSAAPVRTLGLVELLFSVVVSRQWFRERLTRREAAGMAALAAGVVLASQA